MSWESQSEELSNSSELDQFYPNMNSHKEEFKKMLQEKRKEKKELSDQNIIGEGEWLEYSDFPDHFTLRHKVVPETKSEAPQKYIVI